MEAKHETPMKHNKTVLGLVPAKLSTRVIRMRSMLVLLNADAMVNPPISSMIVGENMTENIYLYTQTVKKKIARIASSERLNDLLCGLRCREASVVTVRRPNDA